MLIACKMCIQIFIVLYHTKDVCFYIFATGALMLAVSWYVTHRRECVAVSMVAFQAIDPGSTPGSRKFFFFSIT